MYNIWPVDRVSHGKELQTPGLSRHDLRHTILQPANNSTEGDILGISMRSRRILKHWLGVEDASALRNEQRLLIFPRISCHCRCQSVRAALRAIPRPVHF
jgi:hypothetical protein